MGVVWQRSGAGEDTALRRRRRKGGGVVCPRRQMAWGAGPWWAGAGRAPCAVVGNWGPGWNVGGTLILSATVVLRHRSPLPPPICSFHRSYGKRSCTHMRAHKNIHGQLTYTHIRQRLPPCESAAPGSVAVHQQLFPQDSSSPSRKISLQGSTRSHELPLLFRVILSPKLSCLRVCVTRHNIRPLPHMLVDGRDLCYEQILAPGL